MHRGLDLPFSEIAWRATTSGGPGGQHANRTLSRVEVQFDVACLPDPRPAPTGPAPGAVGPGSAGECVRITLAGAQPRACSPAPGDQARFGAPRATEQDTDPADEELPGAAGRRQAAAVSDQEAPAASGGRRLTRRRVSPSLPIVDGPKARAQRGGTSGHHPALGTGEAELLVGFARHLPARGVHQVIMVHS